MEQKSARNERFVAECLKRLNVARDPEEGLRELLGFLGETLECQRVYVFEDMDGQYLRNTYEWCREGASSGIEQLPYVNKRDLEPWYAILTRGDSVIEEDVASLRKANPLIYGFLASQDIRSLVLTPLMDRGRVYGLLGADDPPPGALEQMSVVFGALAYFVATMLGQRDLERLRRDRNARQSQGRIQPPDQNGKTVLLVDDSPQLLELGARVLAPEGYSILRADTLRRGRMLLEQSHPDVVVAEVDLPDGDGLELGRRTPAVFLTSHSGQRRRGGYAFLTKPYRVEELREAVAAACGRSGDPRSKQERNIRGGISL